MSKRKFTTIHEVHDEVARYLNNYVKKISPTKAKVSVVRGETSEEYITVFVETSTLWGDTLVELSRLLRTDYEITSAVRGTGEPYTMVTFSNVPLFLLFG